MNKGHADILQSILDEVDKSRYPAGLTAAYEVMECLAHNDACETLLVKQQDTDAYFVAKCYMAPSLLSRVTEGELLKGLAHPGLPLFVDEYRNERMLCVVRKYIEGTPLDQYVAQKRVSKQQAVAYAMQLCDILTYLHSQTPPIIHRDIKPQNTIVDHQGNLRLIDFGISRVFDKDARRDTVCFGTMSFAAPEQYGFSQTDCRADIFSLGVWLGWLLTGETELEQIGAKIEDGRLRRIVQKCTSFEPSARYASARQLKKALLNADGHKKKHALLWTAGILACVLCLGAGFIIGRYMESMPAFTSVRGVQFEEPLVEQAVRMVLHMPEDAPISESDLLSATELYIYGDQAAENAPAFNDLDAHMALNDGILKNGGLKSLNDLSEFKNLKTLRIALENITDLTPLTGLNRLETLDLRHNPIVNATPLATLISLREVCLFDTHVTDLSMLSACPLLENIEAGKTEITSIAAFHGVSGLKYLGIRQVPLKTLSGIGEYNHLEQITLSSIMDGNLTPLLALPQLKNVYLDETLREEAEKDLPQGAFRIIYS